MLFDRAAVEQGSWHILHVSRGHSSVQVLQEM